MVWHFWSTNRCSPWPQVQLNLSLSIKNAPASLPPPVIELQTCPNYQMSLLAQYIPQILWYPTHGLPRDLVAYLSWEIAIVRLLNTRYSSLLWTSQFRDFRFIHSNCKWTALNSTRYSGACCGQWTTDLCVQNWFFCVWMDVFVIYRILHKGHLFLLGIPSHCISAPAARMLLRITKLASCTRFESHLR